MRNNKKIFKPPQNASKSLNFLFSTLIFSIYLQSPLKTPTIQNSIIFPSRLIQIHQDVMQKKNTVVKGN